MRCIRLCSLKLGCYNVQECYKVYLGLVLLLDINLIVTKERVEEEHAFANRS
jgi:hypothetical protein